MPQLTFNWPAAISLAASDFIVSPANAQAVDFLKAWPKDNAAAALIYGPEASGKTHLATGWAERTQAAIIDAGELGRADSAALWRGKTHAVLEDIHAVGDEKALFHLLRHAELHGLYLLLTSRPAVRGLSFTLADLRSRLLALPVVEMGAPDEALLKGFLLKCFSDHQLRVGDEVPDYLARRIERSFAAARRAVELLSQRALESGRDITVPLAKLHIP